MMKTGNTKSVHPKRLLKLGGRRAPPYEKSWPSGIRKMSNG